MPNTTNTFIFGLWIAMLPVALQAQQWIYTEPSGETQMQLPPDLGFPSQAGPAVNYAGPEFPGRPVSNPFDALDFSRANLSPPVPTRPPDDREPAGLAVSGGSTVSASELRNRSSKDALRAMDKARRAVANGDRAGAIRELSRAVKKYPTDGRLRTNLGIEYLRGGQIAAALPELEEAARLFPDSSQTAANLADAYFGAAQWSAAEEQARRAARLDPANPRAHLLLGAALLAQGKSLTEAADHLKSSAAAIPESRVLLARLYLRTGERAAAEQELRKFVAGAKGGERTVGEQLLAALVSK